MSTSETPALTARSAPETAVTPSGLFTRNATGLVRAVTQTDNLALAFITGTPTIGLSFGVFFALSGFPGGNFPVAALLALPIALPLVYVFGMLTAAIPRTGGDYTLVTRILSPRLGVIASFSMMLAVMVSVAYILIAATSLAIGPGLQVLGLVGHSHTLFRWGTNVVINKAWKFGMGAALCVVVGAVFMLGMRWTRRFMFFWFLAGVLGLAVSVIVAIFTSKATFIHDFNSFAAPHTHLANTYASIITTARKTGVSTSAAFSFAKTVPLIVVIALYGIYGYTTSYVGGELRQGGSLKTAHRMAVGSAASIIVLLVGALIFFHSWGRDFLTAAYGGGMPPSLGSSPTYFFLTSAQFGSIVVGVVLVGCFLMVWPLAVAINMVITTRTLFAWAFDGLIPRRVANVSSRTAGPTAAVAWTVMLYVLTFAWACFLASSFTQVFSYAALIQFVSMALVAVAGTVFAFRRPEMFRASVSTRRVAGVPLLTILGVCAFASIVFQVWAYIHYKFFAVQGVGTLLIVVGVMTVAALALYALAKVLRRREGVDLSLVYAEIPPE
jgi:basic amino acid/polyamine antiporter, APA family